MSAPITVAAGAATDTGQRRALNEDSLLSSAPLYLVADGMGGHAAGDAASAAVIDEFAALTDRDTVSLEDLRAVLDRARARIEGLSQEQSAGAGTTLSGVAISEVSGAGYWLVLNIGDSRTYRFSRGRLEQISVDHSVVQELIDNGQLRIENAATDGRRHVITRALGAGSNADADFWMIPAETGDRILVCSDGLTGELDDGRIADVLGVEANPQAAASRLVSEAVQHGGRDNVTVVVVDAAAVAADGSPPVPDPYDADADTRPRETAGANG